MIGAALTSVPCLEPPKLEPTHSPTFVHPSGCVTYRRNETLPNIEQPFGGPAAFLCSLPS